MKILAIDPGETKSGWVLFDTRLEGGLGRPIRHGSSTANELLLRTLRHSDDGAGRLVVESFRPRGQPLYQQLITTAIWTGRFIEAWCEAMGSEEVYELMVRETVKLRVCGSINANDARIRAALIDRWGGKEKAVGSKARPGPLYGVSKDAWAALALAVAWTQGATP